MCLCALRLATLTLGAKQLVMDGRAEVGAGVDQGALKFEDDVDMYTDHYYESYSTAVQTLEKDAGKTAVDYPKVFTVGEYGPRGADSLDDLKAFTSTIESLNTTTNQSTTPLVAGDTWWSFFGHGDNFGFVDHGDHYTLHFPGDSDSDQERLMHLRDHAFAMRFGTPAPDDTPVPPIAPALNGFACLNNTNGTTSSCNPAVVASANSNLTTVVTWRGATLAAAYDVQYLTDPKNPSSWTSLSTNATDHQVPFALNPTLFPPGIVCSQAGDGHDSGSSSAALVMRVRGLSLQGAPGPWSQVQDVCQLPDPFQNMSAVLLEKVSPFSGMVRRPLY